MTINGVAQMDLIFRVARNVNRTREILEEDPTGSRERVGRAEARRLANRQIGPETIGTAYYAVSPLFFGELRCQFLYARRQRPIQANERRSHELHSHTHICDHDHTGQR